MLEWLGGIYSSEQGEQHKSRTPTELVVHYLVSHWPTVVPVARYAIGPPLSCVSVHCDPTIHRMGSADATFFRVTL